MSLGLYSFVYFCQRIILKIIWTHEHTNYIILSRQETNITVHYKLSKIHLKQIVRTIIVYTSGTFFEISQKPKTFLNPCSHIQSNTQNMKIIFKLMIYCTKYTQHAKYIRKQMFFRKCSKTNEQLQHFQTFILYFV